MPLTDTAARQAKPQEKAYTLKDSDGLFLYIATNGTKSWHFRFTWHGKQARISMGTYPEIGLRDARERRDEARALVAKGIDPRAERRQAKAEAAVHQENTFEAVPNHRWHAFKLPRWAAARKGAAVQARFYLDKDLIRKTLGCSRHGSTDRTQRLLPQAAGSCQVLLQPIWVP